MPIIRRLLTPATVYPVDLRYNEGTDTVQSNVNGTWVDNPAADPRTQTSFPPRLTADPACDAAQSVVDALIQIDQTVEAIDNASTLFTIAAIILSLFTFGAYAIFITLALGIGNQMVTFGSAAITAALTPAVYDTLKCILFCHMDAQGRLNAGELGVVTGEVTDQIGGIGATIINSMLNLAGEGGINNLASLGTSTGNCVACECGCGDETIGLTMDLFFGSDPEQTGCNVKGTAEVDSGGYTVSWNWNGVNPWKLMVEALVFGNTGTSQWQWYLADGSGPFTGSSAPIGESLQTCNLHGTGGTQFRVSWDVETP